MGYSKGDKRHWLALFILLSLYAFSGCAVYPQVFINGNGDLYRCSSYGEGASGMSRAKQGVGDCVAAMKAEGFLEVEKAGAIGVLLKEQSTPDGKVVHVSRVVNFSPASEAGIKAGDVLVAVGGQKVTDMSQAKYLLFGEAGTPVGLTIVRDGKETAVTITRASYARLFPIPAK